MVGSAYVCSYAVIRLSGRRRVGNGVAMIRGGRAMPFNMRHVCCLCSVPNNRDHNKRTRGRLQRLVITTDNDFAIALSSKGMEHSFILGHPCRNLLIIPNV